MFAAIVCEFWPAVRMRVETSIEGEMMSAIALVSPRARPRPSNVALPTPARA